MRILLLVFLLSLLLAVSASRRKNPKKPNRECTVLNCKNCSRSWVPSCDVCDLGLVRVKVPLGFACWKKCPSRQTEVKGTCKSSVCPPNCKKCRKHICSVCEDGYALTTVLPRRLPACTRKCIKGYKMGVNPMGGLKCVRQCNPNCKKCKNGASCSVCERGYALFKRSFGFKAKCLQKCPKGYKAEVTPMGDKKCVKECQVVSCAVCPKQFQRNKCFKCQPGYYKLPAWRRDFCFSHCPSGYYPKTIKGVLVCKKEPSNELSSTPVASTYATDTPQRPTTTAEPSTTAKPTATAEPSTEPEPTTEDMDFWP